MPQRIGKGIGIDFQAAMQINSRFNPILTKIADLAGKSKQRNLSIRQQMFLLMKSMLFFTW